MENGVNLPDRRLFGKMVFRVPLYPKQLEPVGRLASAFEAGAVPGGKGCCFIEEK
jgi:hypothetical protein